MVELLFAAGMFMLLSASLYQLLRAVRTTFTHSQNKLDILQTTRIMTGIRNELRNANDKPQVFNDRLNILLLLLKLCSISLILRRGALGRGKKGGMMILTLMFPPCVRFYLMMARSWFLNMI